MTNCSAHPSAIAGWSCTSCHRTLCPDCTGWRAAGYGRIELCMHCGAMARRLRAHRSDLAPFRGSMLGSLFWPISAGGIIALFTLAIIVHLLSLLGGWSMLLGDGLASAYLFQILRHTASGHDDLPGPSDFQSLIEGVIEPWFRALVASLWFVIPLFLWMDAKGMSPLNILMREAPVPAAPAAFLLLFLGALLYPMAIIAGSLGAPLTTLFNPLRIVGLSLRVGFDYWLCAVFCFLCTIGAGLVTGVADNFFITHPIAPGGFIAAAITLYLPFVAFRALGLLVRARGDEVGFGRRDSYRVPVLDAQPMHEVKPPGAPPETPHVYVSQTYSPIQLKGGSDAMELTGQERSVDRAERNDRAVNAKRISVELKPSVPASAPKDEHSWRPRRPSSIGPRLDAPAQPATAPPAPAASEPPIRSALDLVAANGARAEAVVQPAAPETPAAQTAIESLETAVTVIRAVPVPSAPASDPSAAEPISVPANGPAATLEKTSEPSAASAASEVPQSAADASQRPMDVSQRPTDAASEAIPAAPDIATAALRAAELSAALAPVQTIAETRAAEPAASTLPDPAPSIESAAPSPESARAPSENPAAPETIPASAQPAEAQVVAPEAVDAPVAVALEAPIQTVPTSPAVVAVESIEAAAKIDLATDAKSEIEQVKAAEPSATLAIPAAPTTPTTPADSTITAPLLPPNPQAARLAKCMALHDLEGARAVLRESGAAVPAVTLSMQSWNELARALAEDAARAQAEERRALSEDVAGANMEEKALLAKAASRARAEEKRALAELALFACRRGVEIAPESALAPRTWLLAARLCDELLRDRVRSNRLLGELLRRFPQTDEGRFAAKRLRGSAG